MATFLRVANGEAVKISEITGASVFNGNDSSVEIVTSTRVYSVKVDHKVTTAHVSEVIEIAGKMLGSSVSWKQAENVLSEAKMNADMLQKTIEDFTRQVKHVFKSIDDFFVGR